jgi:hypothetical protein
MTGIHIRQNGIIIKSLLSREVRRKLVEILTVEILIKEIISD